MLSQYMEQIETIGLNFSLALLFLMIGLSINDVLKKGNVPKFGRYVVWSVLFLGCAGFVIKGIIQLSWESSGIG